MGKTLENQIIFFWNLRATHTERRSQEQEASGKGDRPSTTTWQQIYSTTPQPRILQVMVLIHLRHSHAPRERSWRKSWRRESLKWETSSQYTTTEARVKTSWKKLYARQHNLTLQLTQGSIEEKVVIVCDLIDLDCQSTVLNNCIKTKKRLKRAGRWKKL